MKRDGMTMRPEQQTGQNLFATSAVRRLAKISRGLVPAGQKILTSDGPRLVEELAIDEDALGFDRESGVAAPRRIKRILELAPEPIWKLRLSGDGSRPMAPLRVTRHHAVLTAQGWRRVERLRVGMEILTADADGESLRHKLVGVRDSGVVEPVYALEVADNTPLIVGSLIARGGAPSEAVARLTAQIAAHWGLAAPEDEQAAHSRLHSSGTVRSLV